MSRVRGRRIPLSLPRRLVCDLMRYSKAIPSIPSQRTMRLADVIEARRRHGGRLSWCAIFLKAYSIVSAERPELRRTYMSYPWPHLYEHPENIACFSLERRYRREEGVFFAKIERPEQMSLAQLDELVRFHKVAPIGEIASFRWPLIVSTLPLPLRRGLWWFGLNADGGLKARTFGTFAISVVASLGAAGLHLLSPLTTTLNYGTFQPDGSLDVRLVYDHRVLDGAQVARALAHLEEVLHDEILSELEDLRGAETPAETAAELCGVA